MSEPSSACSKSSSVLLVRRAESRLLPLVVSTLLLESLLLLLLPLPLPLLPLLDGGRKPPERKADGGGLLRTARLSSAARRGGRQPVAHLGVLPESLRRVRFVKCVWNRLARLFVFGIGTRIATRISEFGSGWCCR